MYFCPIIILGHMQVLLQCYCLSFPYFILEQICQIYLKHLKLVPGLMVWVMMPTSLQLTKVDCITTVIDNMSSRISCFSAMHEFKTFFSFSLSLSLSWPKSLFRVFQVPLTLYCQSGHNILTTLASYYMLIPKLPPPKE